MKMFIAGLAVALGSFAVAGPSRAAMQPAPALERAMASNGAGLVTQAVVSQPAFAEPQAPGAADSGVTTVDYYWRDHHRYYYHHRYYHHYRHGVRIGPVVIH